MKKPSLKKNPNSKKLLEPIFLEVTTEDETEDSLSSTSHLPLFIQTPETRAAMERAVAEARAIDKLSRS